MSNPNCPHCGQPMRHMRAGVPMSPRQAQAFDIIKAAGSPGISAEHLAVRMRVRQDCARQHVWGANQRLMPTDFRLQLIDHAAYCLVRICASLDSEPESFRPALVSSQK